MRLVVDDDAGADKHVSSSAALAAEYREQFAKKVEELTGEAGVTEQELKDLVEKNTFDTLPDTLKRVNRNAKDMSAQEAWATIQHRVSKADRAVLGWTDTVLAGDRERE